MTTRCQFATDTGRRWCDCPVRCTEIECRNPARLAALLPDGDGRTDGAAFHSKYSAEHAGDRGNAPFVLVRSRYCCAQHCTDYLDGADPFDPLGGELPLI